MTDFLDGLREECCRKRCQVSFKNETCSKYGRCYAYENIDKTANAVAGAIYSKIENMEIDGDKELLNDFKGHCFSVVREIIEATKERE